ALAAESLGHGPPGGLSCRPMRAAWIAAICALGCTTPGQGPAGPPRITVSQPDGPVALAVGQELEVQLQSNITTGYAWELVVPGPPVLTVIDPGTYRASSGLEPRAGSGGTTSFVFRGVRPGKGALELVYRRPWETGVPPARTLRIEVDVR